MNLLEILAARGSASLHAHGRAGTTVLLDDLPSNLVGPVLEIGCGTGETAVRLSRQTGTVVAVDASPLMLRRARSRSRWCGCQRNLRFVQTSTDGALPFASGSFSTVVIESVLAIQSPDTLRRLVGEARRVVRINGTVLVNETIWMSTTQHAHAEEINRRTAQSTGLIQATLTPFDVDEWAEMFGDSGFRLIRTRRLDDAATLRPAWDHVRFHLIRSRAYTIWRRLRNLITPNEAVNQRRLTGILDDLALPASYVEGILFVLEPDGDL